LARVPVRCSKASGAPSPPLRSFAASRAFRLASAERLAPRRRAARHDGSGWSPWPTLRSFAASRLGARSGLLLEGVRSPWPTLQELRGFARVPARLGVQGRLSGGTPGADWASVLGEVPTERGFYELEIDKPAPEWPYAEKSYVRMLVPRDRSTDEVHFIWRPPVRRD
jgi:hypothetical protein